jgi:hypothetical protein
MRGDANDIEDGSRQLEACGLGGAHPGKQFASMTKVRRRVDLA